MALSDSLTGLANRTLLNDRIQQAVARAERCTRSIASCKINWACAGTLLGTRRFQGARR
jgi:GGDEF domain-containing protein